MDHIFESETAEELLRNFYALVVARKAEAAAHDGYRDGSVRYEGWRAAERQRHEASSKYGQSQDALAALINETL